MDDNMSRRQRTKTLWTIWTFFTLPFVRVTVAERTVGRVGRSRGCKKTWWNEEIKHERQERKRLNKRCKVVRQAMLRGDSGEVDMEEYDRSWDEYKHQQKKVKILIRKEKMKDEKRQLDDLRNKGEEGGKDWYRFLQGKRKEEVKVNELSVNGICVHGKEAMSLAVKEFWENIGGMNDPVIRVSRAWPVGSLPRSLMV